MTLAASTSQWYLLVHILMSIVWVGGAVMLQLLGTRILLGGDPDRLAGFAKDVSWVGSRIFAPASLLILVFGVLLVEEADIGYPFWIVFGLAVFAFSFLSGTIFLGPESGRVSRLIDKEGAADPEAQRRIRRVIAYARFELFLLVLVVIAMVIKPFS